MASTNFVDYSNATPITAAWLNDVNRTQYTILGNPADRAGYIALDTAHAGGTSDAITAAFSVSLSALTDGLIYYVRATAANTTSAPTFTPNIGVITPAVIVRQGGGPLYAGDIPFAGYWMILQYDSTLTKWVLVNPASMGGRLQSIAATVASNAITFTLNPTVLDFRSPTLTTGVPITRGITSAISVVVSNGSTLGSVSGQLTRIAILAIDATSVGGGVELAVVNLAGGNNLDETTLINTTAEGGAGAADSANVIYSATARTGVPFRVVGFVDITEATAGTWATAPTLVQGVGGQALSAMSSIGYGQTWQVLTGSRALGTTYYNTTGKPIQVITSVSNSATQTQLFYVNGVQIVSAQYVYGEQKQLSMIIPPGASYSTTIAGGSLTAWYELR